MPTVRKSNQTVKLLRDPQEGDKLTPQALLIVTILQEHSNELPRHELCETLHNRLPETKQSGSKIFNFYRKRLVEMGLLELVKAA